MLRRARRPLTVVHATDRFYASFRIDRDSLGTYSVTTANVVTVKLGGFPKVGERWILTVDEVDYDYVATFRDDLAVIAQALVKTGCQTQTAGRGLRRTHRPHDHDPARHRDDGAQRLVPDLVDGVNGETPGGGHADRCRSTRRTTGTSRGSWTWPRSTTSSWTAATPSSSRGFEQRVNCIRGPLIIEGDRSENTETFLNEPGAVPAMNKPIPTGFVGTGGTPSSTAPGTIGDVDASHVNASTASAPASTRA